MTKSRLGYTWWPRVGLVFEGVHYNHCVSPSVCGQLVKMLITLEPHGIF